jgi:hypothetical protein
LRARAQADRGNFSANVGLAALAEARGNVMEAISFYETARRLSPADATISTRLQSLQARTKV